MEALARFAPLATFAAVTPPMLVTVAVAEPGPVAETSPVRAVMPALDGDDHVILPAPSLVRTWPFVPRVRGHVRVYGVVPVGSASMPT